MKLFDKLWNCFIFKYKKVKAPKDICIIGRVYIHGFNGGVIFGNGCIVRSNENSNVSSGGNHTHLQVGENAHIIIGSNVKMSQVYITAMNNVTIQDNVMIGACVKIWDTDFHSADYELRLQSKGTKTAPVTIKEGAFIGACSIILKGVTIGKHSVIGAGSVVTNDVPDGEVWAGNPAKFIKRIEKSDIEEQLNGKKQ